MFDTVVLDGDGALENIMQADASLDNVLDGEGSMAISPNAGAYPEYAGPTTITPTTATQTLNTAFKSVLNNITINPIPSNYGLITWDGSTLTVS